MTREEVCNKAIENVCGYRQSDYGSPEDNFNVIAGYWNNYIQHVNRNSLDARDVANMMVLFKMARATTGTGTNDTYVDMAGYAACACEIVSNEEKEDVDK